MEDVSDLKPPKKSSEKKTNSKTATKIPLSERVKNIVLFFKAEQTQRIIGLFYIFIAIYIGVACTSYLFTWQADQDKVVAPSSYLFSADVRVQNWFGKMGALLSHLFMFKWFGVSSFLFVPLFLIGGIAKAFQKNITITSYLWVKSIFIVIWASVILGFIFSDNLFFLGGGFGYIISTALQDVIGNAGVLSLLTLSLMGFIFIVFKITKKEPAPSVENTEEKTTPAEEPKIEEKGTGNKFLFENMHAESEAEKEQEEVIENTEENIQSNETDDFPLEISNTKEEVEEKKTAPINVELEPDNDTLSKKIVEQFGEYDPKLDLASYQMPHVGLLNDYGSIETTISQEELNGNKNKIIETLRNYGIEIEKIKATIGPTVTLYEIIPAAGVRISKIKNLEDDIALSLAALGIRIIAPIPGRGTIGIEVPNQNPEMVPMRNILSSEKFQNSSFDLPIALGKTISNETFIADLSKMPHLLMAGATGQGKSVGLNAVLVSLLYKKHPSQIKFVLVDPKKVELTLYNKIERHFLAKLPNAEDPIITDNTKVVHTLNSLCIEMDNRYALLQDAGVRTLKEYNAKFISRKLNPNDGHKYLPYIVLVVDEFADLIMTAGKEVEMPIARIAQLARAVGIHLIIATQRPSVNIITGVIKANFPARIAFRVTSKIDSRTILDAGGAEQLIGKGDMLLSTGSDLIRIQCAFVDTPEIEKITEFIGSQRGYSDAFLLPEYVDENAEGIEDIDLSERDKMFDDAARIVVQHQQGSASLLQRKLKLGYNRAGRIIDQLEAAGIVGPFEGSKAREVLIKDIVILEDRLRELHNASEK
ncbi:MAG: DNA translocase FtsK 4TM domain-containing protein [Bacteroidetes bacterium]|nr:DNA translocase FtsK 4TM domain-containing protein [Bacteroidota bacterium]